jgi:hypothetical protein
MSTSILDIGEVLGGYSLTSTDATKAKIENAFNFTAVPADGDSVSININGNTATVVYVTSLSGTPADNTIELLISALSNADVARNKTRNALNGDQNSVDGGNLAYGSSTFISAEEGLISVNAINGAGTSQITLEAASTGPDTITIANIQGTVISLSSTLTNTGTDDSGVLSIPLSSLGFSQNDFTSGEAATNGGDYRKFLYHVIEKYYLYLQTYEQVETISIDNGGQSYVVGDPIDFSGGSPDSSAVATVASVDATTGAITSVNISNSGRGYESVPTLDVDSANGINAILTATITSRVPTNLEISRGSLTEDIDTETLNRLYQVTFGFEATALEIKPES